MIVCGLIGSLRKASLNRGLMNAAVEIGAQEGIEIRVWDRLNELPHYNQDLEGDPEAMHIVDDLKRAIREADALLIVTPEYNYSIPGVLKNAIDWASRPPVDSPLKGKPAAIMGVSPGISGTMRCQYHLRQSFVFTQTQALLQPEVIVARGADRFDENQRLKDESTREFVRKQLKALEAWTHTLRGH